MQDATVSVIVPAYNEEKKIKGVLQALVKSSLVNEVICVSDGSTDNTVAIVKSIPNVSLIILKENHGKAYAVAQGVLQAKSDIIVFIDGDLQGVTDEALGLLVKPLLTEHYDGVIGYRSNRYEMIVFRPLTGERAYWRDDILSHIEELKTKGFGLELYLNYLFSRKRTKHVYLPHVKHEFRAAKRSRLTVIKENVSELRDMYREITSHEQPFRFFYYAYFYKFYLNKRP